jgi:hypothetical protein
VWASAVYDEKEEKNLTEQVSEQQSRFAEELRIWAAAGNTAAEHYCEARRIEWRLGGLGVKGTDLPGDWSVAAREHFIDRANIFAYFTFDEFEVALKMQTSHGNLSHTALRNTLRREKSKRERAKQQVQAESVSGAELYVADIRQVNRLRLGEPEAVVTDPPYEAAAVDLWRDLADFSARVLPDRGFLVAMSGQRYLPEVLQHLTGGSLRYVWTMCVETPGAEASSNWLGRGLAVNTYWKPVFVFAKGDGFAGWPAGLSDVLVSPGRDQEHHEWGQNVQPFERLVEFASPGALVCDPFLGGGTTAEAALKAGRNFEGFDIKESVVAEAQRRLRSVTDRR